MDNKLKYFNCIRKIQDYIGDHYEAMGAAANDILKIIAEIWKDEENNE